MAFTTSPFDSTLHGVDDNKSKWADGWFQTLESVVHPVIDDNRKNNQKRTRIAILDTGVDITHPHIQAAKEAKQIVAFFPESANWTADSDSDAFRDSNGHGTHGTSVLLRTAPNSAIYIAKVADEDGKLIYDDIVKAIEWAIQKRVHIISISWGIKDDIPSISTALNQALKAGILVFASASNTGANYPITFPARLHGIFCIGSADGLGAPSTFNPPFEGEEKYSTLGEAVLGACSKTLSDQPGYDAETQTIRRDGTSTATPIAAGIAALFIDYTWQFMDGNAAWTYENIRKLFSRMSKATFGKDYRYIVPWSLFESGREFQTDIKNIITNPLEQDKHWPLASVLGTSTVNVPVLVLQQAPEPTVHFVERNSVTSNDVLGKLAEYRRVIVSGLPGIGKSELARQVVAKAMSVTKTYKGIFWLSGASEEVLHAGIYKIACELSLLNGDSGADIEIIRSMVLNELNSQDNWLMVLDNVDNVDLIKQFLPIQQGTRHILITTRYGEAHMAINGTPIKLPDGITIDEASLLFSKVYRANDQRDTDESEYTIAVTQLVKELGFLPLAIIQAAQYLSETQDDIPSYIRLYRRAREDLWKWTPMQGSHHRSVATIMALSFQKIKHREESVRLLCLISFLAPDSIPEFLLSKDPRREDETLNKVSRSHENLNRALTPLCAYCLVKRSATNHSISVHRVVQDVMRNIIQGGIKDMGNVLQCLDSMEAGPTYWVERAYPILVKAYPNPHDSKTWNLCEVLNPHAVVCLDHAKIYSVETNEVRSLCGSIGRYDLCHGIYGSAGELLEMSLSLAKKMLETDDIETAETINNLGSVYLDQRRYEDAISQFQRASRIYQNLPDIDRKGAADPINNLGRVYHEKGNYKEALTHYRKAQKIWKEQGEEDRMKAAICTYNIGRTYSRMGKHKAAIWQYEKALKVYREIREDTIDMANVLNLLGNEYRAQGKFDAAKAQYKDALNVYEKLFGVDHIHATETLNNIGTIYQDMGHYDDAMSYYKQSRKITEQAFGAGHISTALTIRNIAGVHECKGEYDIAIKVFREALDIYENEFGSEHINVADTIVQLGIAYKNRGEYRLAIGRFEQALKIYKDAFGSESSNAALAISGLGGIYTIQGKYDAAVAQYELALKIHEKSPIINEITTAEIHFNIARIDYIRKKYDASLMRNKTALWIFKKAFGDKHARVAGCLNAIALIYIEQRKFESALTELDRALQINQEKRGPQHADTAVIIGNIGLCYLRQHMYEKAIARWQDQLQIYEGIEPDHIDSANVRSQLGSAFYNQKKYGEASAEFEKALQILEKGYGPDSINALYPASWLARTYKAQYKYDEAILQYKQVLKISKIYHQNALSFSLEIAIVRVYRIMSYASRLQFLVCLAMIIFVWFWFSY